MSKVKNVFITGANRGIGLVLVKQMLEKLQPENIFATYRDSSSSKELLELASQNSNLHLVQLDVKNLDNIQSVIDTVDKATNGNGINLLINNSGVLGNLGLAVTTREQILENLEINTVAPILITQAFLPLLKKASSASSAPLGIAKAAVVNVSTLMGSIADNSSGGYYAYRCSKAALNMATKSMSIDLKDANIIAVTLHPGWVQTDMGGPRGTLTTTQSVNNIVKVLENLNESSNGKFIQHDGKELLW